MARSYGRYGGRRKTGGKDWGRTLKRQVIGAICVVLFILAMKSMGLAATDKAVSVMATYLTQDYTVAEIFENAGEAVATAASWPVSAVTSLRSDSGNFQFTPPADGEGAVLTSALTGGVNGITYGDAKGFEVYAVGGGTVSALEEDAQGKKTIRIVHGNGSESVYRGCSTVYVGVMDRIKKGQIIASVDAALEGEPINSLTFELWVDGRPVNPTEHMDL